MDTNEIVTIIFTSAIIASMVSFLLKYIFENKQKHRFEAEIEKIKHLNDIEVEKLKEVLALDANIQHKIGERRLDSYPRLVELVYRTRNMAKELTSPTYSPTLVEEFRERSKETEDCLYKFRIDLERDNIFIPMHVYKNLLKNFDLTLREIEILKCQENAQDIVQKAMKGRNDIYDEIEIRHKLIIENLSKLSVQYK